MTCLTLIRHVEGQLARWLEELSQYGFRVCHRKGIDHLNADSRNCITDTLPECDCFRAVTTDGDLPWGGGGVLRFL